MHHVLLTSFLRRRRVRRQDISLRFPCEAKKKKKRKRRERDTCGDGHGVKQLVVNVLGTSYYGVTARRLLSLMHRFALIATRDPLDDHSRFLRGEERKWRVCAPKWHVNGARVCGNGWPEYRSWRWHVQPTKCPCGKLPLDTRAAVLCEFCYRKKEMSL